MSLFYISARPATILSLMTSGRLPENMPAYIQPRVITLFKSASESVPTKLVCLFQQIFILELKLPFNPTSLSATHIEIEWIQKVFIYSQKSYKLLSRLFHDTIPKPVEVRQEIFAQKDTLFSPQDAERVYLAVPYQEKDEAKSLGARWDSARKSWYAPLKQNALITRWPLNMTPITHLIGEDPNFSGYTLREYLDVPFADSQLAKKCGALWDPVLKKWYAPNHEMKLLQQWPLRDTTFLVNLLFVDLIPSTCWFTNVRSSVHPSDWDRLRNFIYQRAGNRCECCSSSEARLDAHERWSYNTATKVQKLMRLIALCQDCHEVTHMGFAAISGRSEEAKLHLMKVTRMSQMQAEEHINAAFALWSDRSKFQWSLDLSILTDSGITVVDKPAADERKEIAKKRLREEDAKLELEKPSKRSRTEKK